MFFRPTIYQNIRPYSTIASRKIIIDQDTYGPATTNTQAIAMLLKAPNVDVLGICVCTGDHWRDHQVRHALRLLEIIKRPEVPVVPGSICPLINTREDHAIWEKQHGKLIYKGAWDIDRPGKFHQALHTPDLPHGNPKIKASNENAASFMTRMACTFPGQISLWCAGPLTNVALACRLDHEFPSLIKELHFMGGAFHPSSALREFAHSPRREFNLRFDPEAARIVLRSNWPSITCSPVDVSNHTRSTEEMFQNIKTGNTNLSHFLFEYGIRNRPMWDEVAAATWLDPSLVTHWKKFFIDINLDRGFGYGDMLSWANDYRPNLGEKEVQIQFGLDDVRFYQMFVNLLK